MRDDLDARVVGRARAFGCGVAGCVVDDEDAIDEAGYPLQGPGDQLLLVVGGHDDGDGLTFEHEELFAPALRLPLDLYESRTRISTQSALNPSRQVIFLPSS